MKPKHLAVLLILIITLGVAQQIQVNADQAREKVVAFEQPGETDDIKPRETVTTSQGQYWVVEILRGGRIITLVPVSADTGSIEFEGEHVKDAIKIHYLANYFTTQKSIVDYLSSTRAYARNKQSAFSDKHSSFTASIEPTIPENVTLTKKAAYLLALTTARDNANKLGEATKTAEGAIATIRSVNDIDSLDGMFDEFFGAYDTFLTSLSSLSTRIVEFNTEINAKSNAGELDAQTATIVSLTIQEQGLTQEIIEKRDDVDANKGSIQTNLFGKLSEQVDEFQINLADRVAGGLQDREIKSIQDRVKNLSANYTTVFNNSLALPQYYIDEKNLEQKANTITQKLQIATEECAKGYAECKQIEPSLTDIETLLAEMQQAISSYSPLECTNGKIERGGRCVCPAGTEEDPQGRCVTSQEQQSTGTQTSTLIIIIIVIIIIIAIVYKFTSGGKKDETPEMESSYFGFDNQ